MNHKKVSEVVLQTADTGERRDIVAEYGSYFDDENNHELEDSTSGLD